MKRSISLSAAVLLVGAVGTALPLSSFSASRDDIYAGVTVGAAAVEAKNFDIDNDRDGSGKPSVGVFAGARIGGLPIRAGWPLHAEVGYQSISSHRIPYRLGASSTDLTAKGYALYLAAKLDIPLTDRFDVYSKLGVSRSRVESSTPPGRPVININGSATGGLVAVGLQYALQGRLMLRGEVTSYGKSSSNSTARAVNLGLAYAF